MWFELGHHIVWYILSSECFGGALGLSTQAIDDGSSRSRPNHLC